MVFQLLLRLAALSLAIAILPEAGEGRPLRVVATIKPVHSLTAYVLDGVAAPTLLLEGGASPHSYALKPSDASALSHADVIVRISKNLEVFLNRSLAALPAKAEIIELDAAPGLSLLPLRSDAISSGESGGQHTGEEPHPHGDFDVHFWLDPINGAAIADYLASKFTAIDPDHAPHYEANAKKLRERLVLLDREFRERLAGISGKPFLVFHDVTQYFEKRYGLNGLGAITISPERAPGAKRLAVIRTRIRETQAICVFSEPQFQSKLVDTLIEGTKAKQGLIDEIGAALPPGPEQYFTLLRADAESLASCLKSD